MQYIEDVLTIYKASIMKVPWVLMLGAGGAKAIHNIKLY